MVKIKQWSKIKNQICKEVCLLGRKRMDTIMENVFSIYPIQDILIILMAFIGAVYGIYKAYGHIKSQTRDFIQEKHEEMELPKRIDKLEEHNEKQQEQINLLIQSDRNRIKGELLDALYRCSEQKYIDKRE